MNTKKFLIKRFAVIGGGPVGLYLAIQLANKGHEVIVFEKKSWPIDKVCGQGIMPSGCDILREINIDWKSLDCFSIKGIDYHSNYELSGKFNGEGLGIERMVLSQKLYDLAKGTKGITLKENSIVENLEQKNNKVYLSTADNLEFDRVFACDGLNSKIREKLNNTVRRKDRLRLGAREHFNIAPWSSHVQVFWGNGIEAYVTPVSQHKIEIAFLWFNELIPQGAGLREKLIESFPDLFKKISMDSSAGDFRAYGPFERYARKRRIGNVIFVGDSYHFMDGITGEGISLGLKSAKILAESESNGPFVGEIKLRLLYCNYQLWVKLALFMSWHYKIRKLVFLLLSLNSKMFSRILRFNDLKI